MKTDRMLTVVVALLSIVAVIGFAAVSREFIIMESERKESATDGDKWRDRAIVVPAHMSDGVATPSAESLRMIEKGVWDDTPSGKLTAVRSVQKGLAVVEVAYETADPDALRWPTIEELYDAMETLGVADRAFQTMFGGVDPLRKVRQQAYDANDDEPSRVIVILMEIPNARKLYTIPGANDGN